TEAVPSGGGWTGFGQTAKAGPVLVTPETLVEDSRCPAGVQCIWQGRVVLEATLTVDGRRSRDRLTLGVPHSVAGGSLVMDEVEPLASAQEPIARGDYRFHFEFESN